MIRLAATTVLVALTTSVELVNPANTVVLRIRPRPNSGQRKTRAARGPYGYIYDAGYSAGTYPAGHHDGQREDGCPERNWRPGKCNS